MLLKIYWLQKLKYSSSKIRSYIKYTIIYKIRKNLNICIFYIYYIKRKVVRHDIKPRGIFRKCHLTFLRHNLNRFLDKFNKD